MRAHGPCVASLTIRWLSLGYANVPLDELCYNATLLATSASVSCATSTCSGPARPTSLRISVTPAVYLVALVAFVGWFLFTIFAGYPPPRCAENVPAFMPLCPMPRMRPARCSHRCWDLNRARHRWRGVCSVGLVALPLDLVSEYTQRPHPIDLEEYAKQRMLLNQRAKQLLEVRGHACLRRNACA